MSTDDGTPRQVAVSRLALSRCRRMAARLRLLRRSHGALCHQGTLNVADVAIHYEIGDGGITRALDIATQLLRQYEILNIGIMDREAWLVLRHTEPDACDNGNRPPVARPEEASLSFIVRMEDPDEGRADHALDMIEAIIGMS
jgi:hypothetical protein